MVAKAARLSLVTCPRCGAFPPPYVHACPQCGTPFGFAAGPAMAPLPVDPRTGARSGTGIAIVIVAVVGALMMLGMVGGLVFAQSTARPVAPSDFPTVETVETAPPPTTAEAPTETPQVGGLKPVSALPHTSPPSTKSLTIVVKNHRDTPIDLVWITFKGARQRYATIPAGGVYRQQTYAGHVWVATAGTSSDLGGFVAAQQQADPLATGGFTQTIAIE
jgi:hypothetical protein